MTLVAVGYLAALIFLAGFFLGIGWALGSEGFSMGCALIAN